MGVTLRKRRTEQGDLLQANIPFANLVIGKVLFVYKVVAVSSRTHKESHLLTFSLNFRPGKQTKQNKTLEQESLYEYLIVSVL